MDSWKLGLTINGQWYDNRELLAYSSNQIVSVISPWEKEIYRFIINWLSDMDHIVQFSSGTTGMPKEIRLPKVSMMQSAKLTCDYLKIKEGNTALLCMPVDYIAGRMMIVRSMVCGLNLMIVEPKSLPEIEFLPDIDFAAMVPMQALNLLNCKNELEKCKKLLIGGAQINSELENHLKSVKTEAYATYGMAETASHIALKRLNGPDKDKYFIVLPGVGISVDSRQCLIINAPWIKYQVNTNDLVEITGNDSFRWLGRFDNLINSGGIKIVPEEVESLVMSKTGKECLALGIPDQVLGQRLVFVVEKKQVTGSPGDLKSDLESVLPRRWKPKEIIIIPEFPRNDALKIDRKQLISLIKKQ